jgi:peptidoglycan/LPS O-acetylase OafA/YrhL
MIARDHRIREKLSNNVWILRVAVGFSGAVVTVFFLKGWTMQTRPMSIIGYTCIGAFYLTLLLFAVIHYQGWWARILRTPLLRHLGKLAYCLYMIHTSTLAIMESVVYRITGRAQPSWISATTGLLVALILSEVSWHFFESKMIRIGHTFSYGITRTDSQLVAAGGGGV